MKANRRRLMLWGAAAAVVALVGWSFAPRPIAVEVAHVATGPLTVTIDEDGRTRVRDRYDVSAPVSGYLSRIGLRPGAPVVAGQIVANIFAVPPAPIDARSRSQLEARVDAAVDASRQARTRVEGARATLAQAVRELDRLRQLERERVVSAQETEVARTRQQVAEAEVSAAIAGADAAQHEVEAARAALMAADVARPVGRASNVRAPKTGVVLKVFEESERAVQAGTPLIEIGEPGALEVVADLVSTDAVQVRPGAKVFIERWGGETPLNGRVRLIEPSSFTKVSALGVEEQRVNVVIDLTDPPERWRQLGDGFAVEVRVVVWECSEGLKAPVSALFRSRGSDWAVYKVVEGRALEQRIVISRQNDAEAVVTSGLAGGDVVVVHPSERVVDRTRVVVR